RDNWYLDAWCHLRRALRSFSIDRVHPVYIDDKPARQISEKRLDQYFGDAYGIFTGKAKHTAEIRFTAEAAKWVADEQWHPRQELVVHPDGSCTLAVPYGDPRELIREILKHSGDAKVARPAALRNEVRARLEAALARYEK
ncbi:MAG: WYL domain-containing protein, partial [Pseudomonadota bacterium]|nr:WYL domain-containing protein [Pseudomonadota bacterium]